MEEKITEEQELIPGTNIPRPRYRGVYETDEEYVEYLKGYYGQYFPELDNENKEENTVDETVEATVLEAEDTSNVNVEISDSEIETIKNNLENYADSINNNTESTEYQFNTTPAVEEPTVNEFTFDTSSVNRDDFSIQTSQAQQQSSVDDFSFDTTGIVEDTNESLEIDSITDSNDLLRTKVKSASLWNKVSTFFSNVRASFVEKAIDFFADASDAIVEDNRVVAGRVR